jgi:hypothetical protein
VARDHDLAVPDEASPGSGPCRRRHSLLTVPYDGVTTWRLYSAEQSFGLGESLKDVDAARRLVRKIKGSRWWRENVIEHARISLELGGEDLGEGGVTSYARSDTEYLPERWKISVHPEMLNDLVVLHELAHCIAPRWSPSPKRRRKGQLPGHAPLQLHGAGFAGAMAELVREFGEGAVHDELRDAYNHFGVPVMTPAECRVAVATSLEAERDLAAWHEELAEHFGSHPMMLEWSPTGWIPERRWGDALLLVRTHGGRLGMDRLARIVSRVEPCTRNDIRTIESAMDLPDDIRLRRIALCMAVAFGQDPIYMGYQLGLAPRECDIELEDLESINPDWVDLVLTMNQQLAERPPKWVVEGMAVSRSVIM